MNNTDLVHFLSERRVCTQSLNALVGFDGFVDRLARVVRHRQADGSWQSYVNISGFADRIAAAAGKNADLELRIREERFGGNAPIMGSALGCLGVQTDCAGALGLPEAVHPVFLNMSGRCVLHPVCRPGETLALEFDDGKIMLADLSAFDELDWAFIKESIGCEKLLGLAKACDLIALVNWSLMRNAHDIWTGFRDEILAGINNQGRRPLIFFDIADPSKHSGTSVSRCMALIGSFREYGETTLGLNENEARRIYEAISGDSPDGISLERIAASLYDRVCVDVLLVHPRDGCIVVSREGERRSEGILIQKPIVSTGAGDHFNAGYCFGRLHRLEPVDAAQLGIAVSGYYVEHGKSPAVDELIKRLTDT